MKLIGWSIMYPPSSGLIDEDYVRTSVGLLKKYLGEMVKSNIDDLHSGIMKQATIEKQDCCSSN